MAVKKAELKPELLRQIVTGCVVALLASMLVCGVCAVLIANEVVGEEGARICSMAALGVGAALGAAYSSGKRGERYIVTALLTGAVFALVRLLCSLSGDGDAQAALGMGEALIAILAGSVIGGLPKNKSRGRKKRFSSK